MSKDAKKRGRRSAQPHVHTTSLVPVGSARVPIGPRPPAAPPDKEVPPRRPLPPVPEARDPDDPHRPPHDRPQESRTLLPDNRPEGE